LGGNDAGATGALGSGGRDAAAGTWVISVEYCTCEDYAAPAKAQYFCRHRLSAAIEVHRVVTLTLYEPVMAETDAPRRNLLATLALADPSDLAARWEAFAPKPAHTVVRGPETGLVMVRGRIGGGGASFNVGEATMTRCVVRLESGEVGFGHVLGRDGDRARLVALLDALCQAPAHAGRVREEVIAPLAAARQAERRRDAEEVAATRVDFFTMARGED